MSQKDATKTIDDMKKTAMERCCDRINKAAEKARGVKNIYKIEETHGVSTILKRKHGL
jgi:hypothetical protein